MTNPASDNYTVDSVNSGELINRLNTAVNTTGVDGNTEYSMPLDGLPKKFVEFVREVAEVRQVPVEVVALSALTVAGAAAGGNLTCRMGGYKNTAALLTIINAPSGAGKSQPMQDVMQPLDEVDKELVRQYQDKVVLWKQAQDGKAPTATTAPRPPKTQIKCGSQSDAALMDFLCANKRGGILFVDELRALFANFGSKHNLKAEPRMLTIADGRPVKDDTKTNDEIMLCQRPFLAVLGGIQPGILRRTIKPDYIDSGLFGRFIITTFEDNDDDDPCEDVSEIKRRYWNMTVRRLFNMGDTEHEYAPSEEAIAVYQDEVRKLSEYRRAKIEAAQARVYTCDDKKVKEYISFIRATCKKTRTFATRLAFLSMLLRQAHSAPYCLQHGSFTVEPQDIKWAFSCAPYIVRQKVDAYEDICGIVEKSPTAANVEKSNTGVNAEKKPITTPDMCRMLAEFCQHQGLQHSQNEIAAFLGVNKGNFSKYVKP